MFEFDGAANIRGEAFEGSSPVEISVVFSLQLQLFRSGEVKLSLVAGAENDVVSAWLLALPTFDTVALIVEEVSATGEALLTQGRCKLDIGWV